MKKKIEWFYVLVFILLGAMLFINIRFFRGSAGTAVGVAQSKDYKITVEKSAKVKSIQVISGQQVREGDVLVELESSDLDIAIEKLKNRIQAKETEQSMKSKLTGSNIAIVKAEEGVKIEELTSRIDEIKNELKLNRALTGKTKSDSSDADRGPLEVRAQSLQAQKTQYENAVRIKIGELEKENALAQTELTNEVALMRQELGLLMSQKETLIKRAVADGVVENIYVKPGEELDAFTPLLSVAPVHPAMVVAYLVGDRHSGYAIGSHVMVSGYGHASTESQIKGKVIGYGSVSPLPEILQKSTAVKAFGREVYIEIPPDNNFANGQKVLIR